jgi:aromatic-L-amino-acid decarboxylase
MDPEHFRRSAHTVADWMVDYLGDIERLPVMSTARPGDVLDRLPREPPQRAEPLERIMADLDTVIMPGVTHWQHPSFFAYFPANSAPPAVLAEMVTATLGLQCMMWQTSPAATELEQRMMEWLRDMLGLPPGLTGVIQDAASTATLCAIISARERVTGRSSNEDGMAGGPALTAYCSQETHSSIEKGVKIAGLGRRNLRKVPVDEAYAMVPGQLERAIEEDKATGLRPAIVVATIGTTGSTAIDPVRAIGDVCRRHGVWLHVDAAHAGTALLLPEMRWMADGVELADSIVLNPHKWMGATLPCSAYFVKDPEALVGAFEIMPEYLRTGEEGVTNYRDWGIQLGRRFNALKLWFLVRSNGVEGLQEMVRGHIALARELAGWVDAAEDFELLAPVPLNTVCFRHHPRGMDDPEALDRHNEGLLERLNRTGKAYMTHTRLGGAYAIRLVVGQTHVERRHVEAAWRLVQGTAGSMGTTGPPTTARRQTTRDP